MGHPVVVARLRVLNGDGVYDSYTEGVQARVTWKTKHTLSDSPNEAVIGLYNPKPSTVASIMGVARRRFEWTPAERAQLLAAGASASPLAETADSFALGAVELSTGVADSANFRVLPALSLLFAGEMTEAPIDEPSGQDSILTFRCLDGGHTMGAAEVVQAAGGGVVEWSGKAYTAGTHTGDILADLINAIGLSVDRDKIKAQLVAAMARKGYPAAEILSGGTNISGAARPKIAAIMSSLDLRWSIQNGKFLVLEPTGVLPGYAPIKLSTQLANIYGRPKRKGDQLEVTTEPSTAAIPGRQVDVRTEDITASYRIDESIREGDTYGGASTLLRLDELV